MIFPRNPIDRRRRAWLTFGVLAAGIVVSALVVALLVFLGQAPPRS
jgi:type IV secretory pathway component VirB8